MVLAQLAYHLESFPTISKINSIWIKKKHFSAKKNNRNLKSRKSIQPGAEGYHLNQSENLSYYIKKKKKDLTHLLNNATKVQTTTM